MTGKEAHVQNMWQMLRNFTPKQRELFLRFVWGRSRLPISSEYFDQVRRMPSAGGERVLVVTVDALGTSRSLW
jgi:hypothetical protein